MKTAIFSFSTVILTLLILIRIPVKAQVTDDFSDGDFTHNPRWEGDSMHFEVNGARQLHLKWTGSDTSILATTNQRVHDTEWTFWAKLSFNTSANNYLRVYLVSDNKEFSQPLNGYFLRVGGSSDSVSFMKQTGKDVEALFRFPDLTTSQSTNTMRIKLIRDGTGCWTAWADPAGGESYLEQGSWTDNTCQNTSWFGFWCRYTSSNATKFYMDDIYIGPVIRDTIPPRLASLTLPDSMHIRLLFTESPEPSGALDKQNYTLVGTMSHPDTVIGTDGQPEAVLLEFNTPFPPQIRDTLQITGIADPAGNSMQDTLVPFVMYGPKAYDIVIHEVMMDPEPVTGLPPAEYVELYNRTNFPINLHGWLFDYGSTRKTLPEVVIPPSGYLLLSRDTLMAGWGLSVPLFTSSTSLANDGTTLVLRDSRLRIIHSVTYSPDWLDASWKEEGGWSLEMIDAGNPCGCRENWGASRDPNGGTPGRANSIAGPNPDLTPPKLLRSHLEAPATWEVVFSESLDTTTLGNPGEWTLEPGGSHPESIVPVAVPYQALRLAFPEPFDNGRIYTLSGSYPVTDCAGNAAVFPLTTRAAIPQSIERHDVIINEVLHDPYPGSTRFFELYNRSDKVIDLKEISVIVADTGISSGKDGAVNLSGGSYLMFPFECVAVCSDEDKVKQYYKTLNPDRFLEMGSFPSMNNDCGAIRLIRSCDEELIDGMEYHTGMHYPLLVSAEGVSLERISPERPATEPSNWHSAGANAGYATPAYENSQWMDPEITADLITITPPVFSPDNDGHDDVVSIGLSTGEAGFQATVRIFDASGRLVRQLASNTLTGTNAGFLWDGICEDGTKASWGIYIVYVELLHPGGSVRRVKKPVVVGGKY